MNVEHFIIHYIQKDQFREPTVQASDEEASLTGPAGKPTVQGKLITDFVTNAATMFNRQKSGRSYADIGKDGNTFAEVLDRYLAKKLSFIKFSQRLAAELSKAMTGASLATGGYMAIAQYTASPRSLLVIMIRQEEGYAVDPVTLKLRSSVHLDLSTINVGAKIDLEAYAAGEIHPLALVRGLKEVAKYFRTFLGVTNFKSPRDETEDLATVMHAYFDQHADDYDSNRISEIKRTVANIIRENKGTSTPLLTLAAAINAANPEDFFDFANEQGISADLNGEPEVVKSWLRVRYKNPRLLLDFDKALLHDSIHWNQTANQLVLDVDKFPALSDRLAEAEE